MPLLFRLFFTDNLPNRIVGFNGHILAGFIRSLRLPGFAQGSQNNLFRYVELLFRLQLNPDFLPDKLFRLKLDFLRRNSGAPVNWLKNFRLGFSNELRRQRYFGFRLRFGPDLDFLPDRFFRFRFGFSNEPFGLTDVPSESIVVPFGFSGQPFWQNAAHFSWNVVPSGYKGELFRFSR